MALYLLEVLVAGRLGGGKQFVVASCLLGVSYNLMDVMDVFDERFVVREVSRLVCLVW